MRVGDRIKIGTKIGVRCVRVVKMGARGVELEGRTSHDYSVGDVVHVQGKTMEITGLLMDGETGRTSFRIDPLRIRRE